MPDNFPAKWAVEEFEKRSYRPDGGPSNAVTYTYGQVKLNPNRMRRIIEGARLIEKYEQPPVDPDLLEARRLYSSEYVYERTKSKIMDGTYDGDGFIRGYMMAKGKSDYLNG